METQELMENKNILLAFGISLSVILSATAQKKKSKTNRGYAFEGRNLVIGLGSGPFGSSYGYGESGGVPLILSIEYGVHRYVGIGIYGGMIHHSPILKDKKYRLSVYTFGPRLNFHLYNLVDDLIKKNLRGDIIDIYGTLSVGADYFDTDILMDGKFTYYFTGGVGIRAYPFKKVRGLGLSMEFTNILTPWLIGLNYKF